MNYQSFRSKQKDFMSKNGIIKYTDTGSGPPILLLHGFPVSSWIYHKLIPILKNSGFRVIAPDMLGYGSSDSPKNRDVYKPVHQAKSILSLMNHLKINKWMHVTHDFGGPVTWELMKIKPKSLTHLFILNTILLPEGFHPPFVSSFTFINKIISKLYAFKLLNKNLVKSLLKTTLYKEKGNSTLIEGIRTPWNEGKTEAIVHFLIFINNPFYDLEKIFNDFSGMITIIWGKYDDVLQWADQKDKLKSIIRINNSDIHLVEGSHYIQYENAVELGKIISDSKK